jgi:hypothetical protein
MNILKTLTLGAILFSLSAPASKITDEELEELELLGDDPPVLNFAAPPTRKPKSVKSDFESEAAEYCLCKCLMKGTNPARAKAFRGKKNKQSCLCECAVR